MNQNIYSLKKPLVSIFHDSYRSSFWLNLLRLIAGNLLLILSSKIAIPLQPVPVTLQTTAIFFIAMIYGWRLGLATLSIYLTEAFVGLPVFAGHVAGYQILFGPTSGYLAGFVIATVISGFLAEYGWGKHGWTALLAQLAALIPLYFLGVSILTLFTHHLSQAIQLGFMPFLIICPIKTVVLSLIIPYFWRTQDHATSNE